MKFKVWFANDPEFTKRGVKKKALSLKVKNPNDNGGALEVLLDPGQWESVRKTVEGVSGATVYWYVESSDPAGRKAKTDITSFTLTD